MDWCPTKGGVKDSPAHHQRKQVEDLDSRGLRGHKLFLRTRKFSEQTHGQ